MMDTSFEAILDEGCAGGPVASTIGDVVLHTCLWVDIELDVANWRS